jgi:hypothetical protein
MGRQQITHGEQIVKYEHAFLLHFRIRRDGVEYLHRHHPCRMQHPHVIMAILHRHAGRRRNPNRRGSAEKYVRPRFGMLDIVACQHGGKPRQRPRASMSAPRRLRETSGPQHRDQRLVVLLAQVEQRQVRIPP